MIEVLIICLSGNCVLNDFKILPENFYRLNTIHIFLCDCLLSNESIVLEDVSINA